MCTKSGLERKEGKENESEEHVHMHVRLKGPGNRLANQPASTLTGRLPHVVGVPEAHAGTDSNALPNNPLLLSDPPG